MSLNRRIGVRCYLNGHDIWMGCYWKHMKIIGDLRTRTVRPLTTIYLCPLFCFVIEVTILGKEEKL
jgi:hypothetical protein